MVFIFIFILLPVFGSRLQRSRPHHAGRLPKTGTVKIIHMRGTVQLSGYWGQNRGLPPSPHPPRDDVQVRVRWAAAGFRLGQHAVVTFQSRTTTMA